MSRTFSDSQTVNRRGPTGLADRLTLVVDAALAGTVLIAPYLMGGRHPIGQFVFVALAVVMAVAWMVRQWSVGEGAWRFSGLEVLLLLAVLVTGLQTVPLPPRVLTALSPAAGNILPPPLAGETTAQTGWPYVSLVPAATRDGLIVLLAHGLVALVVIQRIKSVRDMERLLHLLAAGVVLMAAIGLAQYFFGNGRFLWVYEHPRRTTDGVVKGSFINRNHFAQFLALGVGPLVWCIARALRECNSSDSRDANRSKVQLAVVLPSLGLAVVMFAGLFSLSRGGAIALAVALGVSGWMLWQSGVLSLRFIGAAAAVTLLAGGSLLLYGYDKVERRLDDLTEGSINRLDNSGGRRRVWEANWRALKEHPWLGTGVGTHADVYPMYMTEWMPVDYTHAESGYVQIASSMGAAGLVLLLATIGLGGYVCWRGAVDSRDARLSMCLAAVAGSLAASVIHSVVDFVWFIPACMSVTAMCGGCAVRCWMMSRPAGEPRLQLPRPAWGAAALAVMTVGAWMIIGQWRPARASLDWDAYLRDDVAVQRLTSAALGGKVAWTPEQVAQTMSQRRDSMFHHLRAVVATSPDDARAHMALAGEYLLRFEAWQQRSANKMSLSQISDAAMDSRRTKPQETEKWLVRFLGDNLGNLQAALWHARRAISLSPLQGEAYIFLSQVCFLEGGDVQVRQKYVAHALRVRPLNEGVLVGAVDDAMLRGDNNAALSLIKQAFHLGGRFRPIAIRMCYGRLPVAEFLEQIQPELDAWPELNTAYRQLNQEDEMRVLCAYYVNLAEKRGAEFTGDPAAQMWTDVGEVNMLLGDVGAAAECARRAVRCSPDNKKTRTFCSLTLSAAGLYEEAEPHIRWCLQRSPDNGTLQILARKATEARVFGKDRMAAGVQPAAPH